MAMTEDERTRLCIHEDPAIQGFLAGLATGSAGTNRKPKSTETIESYRGTLDRLCAWKTADWDRLTTDDLWEYINLPSAVTGRPISQNTVCQRRSAVVQFFRWLYRKGVIESDTTEELGSPGQAETDRHPVSDADWVKLASSDMSPDDRLVLGLGYYCGMRREEIVTLTPQAINPLLEKIMFFARKGGKTKRGLGYGALIRILQQGLPHLAVGADEWVDIVESYARLRAHELHLWPAALGKNDGQRLRDRLEHHTLPAAGLDSRAFTPHQLRHSFATNMILCGMPIEILADAMSHSKIETTRAYIDMTNQVEAWFNRANAPKANGSAVQWQVVS